MSPSAPIAASEPDGGFTRGRYLPESAKRHRLGKLWRWILLGAIVAGLVALLALVADVANGTFGVVAVRRRIDPATLADRPLAELSKEELLSILETHISQGLWRRFERERSFDARSRDEVYGLVEERVIQEEVVGSWPLSDFLFHRAEIERQMATEMDDARLQFKSWINAGFLTRTMSSTPAQAGVRTAVLGSLWMIALTIAFAFPVGVAAAVYLEEYAGRTRLNRLIQTNIDNLAGVPSIIYGMLGLAVFVRALEPLSSGAAFGVTESNGRTIVSASLTMALLILPLIIINAQEAIRAVPQSLRQASYGLGATRWQTIWGHVLPSALPGILTGTILAISRAIGETAPLIVVGASTYITVDPEGPFSKFTALPVQIYNWTSRPQDQFRNIAAAAILVLLILLLTLNATAVLLRNRVSRRMG
jgi:phosphate transport system permease protein